MLPRAHTGGGGRNGLCCCFFFFFEDWIKFIDCFVQVFLFLFSRLSRSFAKGALVLVTLHLIFFILLQTFPSFPSVLSLLSLSLCTFSVSFSLYFFFFSLCLYLLLLSLSLSLSLSLVAFTFLSLSVFLCPRVPIVRSLLRVAFSEIGEKKRMPRRGPTPSAQWHHRRVVDSSTHSL